MAEALDDENAVHHSYHLSGAVSASGMRLSLDLIDEPVLLQAVSYWQKLAINGTPSRRAIDPVELGARILPHVFLADVLTGEPRFIFRLAGSAIEREFGFLKGRTLDDLNLGTELQQIKNQYNDAISEKSPVYCVQNFASQDHRRRNYKRAVMPLCTGGKEIDGLFGAIIFSE